MQGSLRLQHFFALAKYVHVLPPGIYKLPCNNTYNECPLWEAKYRQDCTWFTPKVPSYAGFDKQITGTEDDKELGKTYFITPQKSRHWLSKAVFIPGSGSDLTYVRGRPFELISPLWTKKNSNESSALKWWRALTSILEYSQELPKVQNVYWFALRSQGGLLPVSQGGEEKGGSALHHTSHWNEPLLPCQAWWWGQHVHDWRLGSTPGCLALLVVTPIYEVSNILGFVAMKKNCFAAQLITFGWRFNIQDLTGIDAIDRQPCVE